MCEIAIRLAFMLATCCAFERVLAEDASPTVPGPKTSTSANSVVITHAQRVQRLSAAEATSAAALPDEDGALWKIRVTETSRKNNLLGRSALFTMSGGFCGFNEYLIDRLSGKANWTHPIQLPGTIDQVVGDQFRIACTITRPGDGHPDPDIVYLDKQFMLSQTGARELLLKGHEQAPWRMTFSPNHLRLCSCSDDGTIRLWDVEEDSAVGWIGPNGRRQRVNPQLGKEIASFPGYLSDKQGNECHGEFVAFSPYGRWLATAFEQRVSFRFPINGKEVFAWTPTIDNGARIMSIRFDPLGNNLFAFIEYASESRNPTVKFMQFDLNRGIDRQFVGTHGVTDGRATEDGKYVVTWDGSPTVVIWDIEQHAELATIHAAPQHIYDVVVSPMGDVLATAGDDNEVKFWTIADQSRVKTASTFKHDGVDLLQVSTDGKRMVTGSDDGWLRGWNTPPCFWDRRENPATEIGTNAATLTQRFADGTVREIYNDSGIVVETRPNGEVKKYTRQ